MQRENKTLNTLIDEYFESIILGIIKKDSEEMSDEYIYKLAVIQDLKSRKQELIEGIVEIIHKEKIISNNNTWQEGFDYCKDAVMKRLTGK